jgi:ferric-dicitrate binding protein FerR (iron transport regulator)
MEWRGNGIGVTGWWGNGSGEEERAWGDEEMAIEAARTRAVLVTGDGVRVELEERDTVIAIDRRAVMIAGGEMVYEKGTLEEEDEETGRGGRDRLIVPAGGIFTVTLGDGTRVFLNSGSELEYPMTFGAGGREVYLKGEAFFEVEALEGRPFVVETREVSTRVLGTSFNVHAYEEEGRVAVTLLSGSVEVEAGDDGRSTRLVPGTAAVWTRATGALERRETRATDAIAWRDGAFIFTGEKLVQVTRALTRWHGVRFVYPDEGVEGLLFTGRVNMEEALPRVLESITIAGGPSFRVVDETVYVLK